MHRESSHLRVYLYQIRRRPLTGYAAAILLIILLSTAVWRQQVESQAVESMPELIIDESVAGDFEALARETWDQFLTTFRARTNCFGDVRLRAARTLKGRAIYDPDSATVTVRVPGTPAMLKGALIHEWAHHLEFQCEQHQALRPAFLAAQRLPSHTPWRSDQASTQPSIGEWSDIPSEQFAEATIYVVLGRRHIPTKIRVTQEAIQVVEAWAAGD